MSAKAVTIDHPHAEVIAAYYSGKTVQTRGYLSGWIDLSLATERESPRFLEDSEWRIKPELREVWAAYSRFGEFIYAHNKRYSADEVASREHGRTVVRMVEQPE